MLERTGVSLTQSVTIEERTSITIGIGGLFWYSLPEFQANFHTRVIKFGPAIGQAQLQVKLGSLQNPWGKLQAGLVPYKYNPDAKNLGEYLMRSTAYPNILVTGGWSIINSAGILMQGLNFEAKTGPLTHNILMSIEWGLGPQHDITPAYLVDYKPVEAIDIGAGVAFAYLIPIRPSITTPDYAGLPTQAKQRALGRYKDTVVTDINDTVGYKNYTNQAVKLMARASFNLQAVLKSDMLGSEDLKLYTEAAVLGVKNYPYYYTNIMRRIPVMVGFNFPTFKFLDRLSLELEFRNPEFLNSSRVSFEEDGLPLPYIPHTFNSYDTVLSVYKSPIRPAWDSSGRIRDPITDTIIKPGGQMILQSELMKDRGFKWSVYAKRTIIPGITVYCQAASDHMRGIHFRGYPLSNPLPDTWKDWYFLFRVELGI